MEDRYEKCIGNLVSFKYKTKEALKRHASPYLCGLYNGLELALSLLDGREGCAEFIDPDGRIVPPGQK